MKKSTNTLAFEEHQKDRILPEKHQTPDNYWSGWFEKGYRAAQERHAKELQELKTRAVECYMANCRTYTPCCFDKKPCTADCEYLADFTRTLNEPCNNNNTYEKPKILAQSVARKSKCQPMNYQQFQIKKR